MVAVEHGRHEFVLALPRSRATLPAAEPPVQRGCPPCHGILYRTAALVQKDTAAPKTFAETVTVMDDGCGRWLDRQNADRIGQVLSAAETPEDRPRYDASHFPIVEIDRSYYGLPTPEYIGSTLEDLVSA